MFMSFSFVLQNTHHGWVICFAYGCSPSLKQPFDPILYCPQRGSPKAAILGFSNESIHHFLLLMSAPSVCDFPSPMQLQLPYISEGMPDRFLSVKSYCIHPCPLHLSLIVLVDCSPVSFRPCHPMQPLCSCLLALKE